MNNCAVVAKLKNIRKIEGADKIVVCDVVLNGISISEIVVGNDTVEDTLVVYFDSNMCLTPTITTDYPDIARYLSKGTRVKVVRLKGQISNGLAVEVSKFYKYFKSDKEAQKILVEGYEFTSIDKTQICHKYVVVNQRSTNSKGKGKKIHKKSKYFIADNFFLKHSDTSQLLRNIHALNPNDIIQVSTKVHGTSFRVQNALIKKNLSIFEKIGKWLGIKIKESEYKYVYGSRNCVNEIEGINDEKLTDTCDYYKKQNIWIDMGKKHFKGKLHEGETIYGEIVGYLSNGKAIQSIGKWIFNYGCNVGEAKVKVYRITNTDQNGNVKELSVKQYQERCNELGVEYVTELYYGKASKMYDINVDDNWRRNFIFVLSNYCLDKVSPNCLGGAIEEGVCIRIIEYFHANINEYSENKSYEVYKLKSPKFLLGESVSTDKGDIQDTEESEG